MACIRLALLKLLGTDRIGMRDTERESVKTPLLNRSVQENNLPAWVKDYLWPV